MTRRRITIAALLVLCWLLLWISFGGVRPGMRAVVMMVLSWGAAQLAMGSDDIDDHHVEKGVIWAVALAALALVGPVLFGLGDPWRLTMARVAGMLDSLSLVVLLATMYTLGAAVSGRRLVDRAELVLVAFAYVAAAVAAVHVVADWHALGGWVGSTLETPRFYAPFVNPNHFAASMLVAFPAAVRRLSARRSMSHRVAGGLAAAVCVTAVVFASAAGPLLCLMAQAAVLLLLLRPRWSVLALLAAPVGVALALQRASEFGSDPFESLGRRGALWWDALGAAATRPFFGFGAGTFGTSLSPFRTDHSFEGWAHAHNDYVEWVFEHGLLGALLLVVALGLVWPWGRRASSTKRGFVVLCVGLAVYAGVDFPMQLAFFPASGALALGLLAGRKRSSGADGMSSAGLGRWAMVLALSCIAAGGWEARGAVERRLLQRALSGDEDAATYVDWIAPWRPEGRVARLRSQANASASDVVDLATGWSHHPAAMLAACEAALKAGRDDAVAHCRAATEVAPWDGRAWVLHALAVEATGHDAVEAWTLAMHAGVPSAHVRGWRHLPVGLYWADQVSDAPDRVVREVARFLRAQDDPAAARIALDVLVARDPRHFEELYVRVAAESGDHAAVLAHIGGLPPHIQDRPHVRAAHAESLEQLGRWAEAEGLWLDAFQATGRGLTRAAIARTKRRSLDEGRTLWRDGHERRSRVAPEEYVTFARFLRDEGRAEYCVAHLQGSEALAHEATRQAAAALLADCRASQ